MDREFIILESIHENYNITQRQLSKLAGLSLGSVNILLSKMVREGLIKIEKIPANRIVYMLTPKGMLEKVNKTYNYIKIHYNYINKTKESIKSYLLSLSKKVGQVTVLMENDELSEITRTAIQELGAGDISCVNKIDDYTHCYVVVLNESRYLELLEKGCRVQNLLQVL
ncbi:MAG TPA: MarR family transcriptional regulator [Clostridiaceae bacterium]|nr:MarR family transcriptional regulator [Clostridiaceae bacterium]